MPIHHAPIHHALIHHALRRTSSGTCHPNRGTRELRDDSETTSSHSPLPLRRGQGEGNAEVIFLAFPTALESCSPCYGGIV